MKVIWSGKKNWTKEDYMIFVIANTVTNSVTGCWEWQLNKDKNGYGRTSIYGQSMLAHRLSYTVFKKKIPFGKFACHKCDNPSCSNPDHIFIGTNLDNVLDMIKKNRMNPAMGERTPTAKIKEFEVLEIRQLAEMGFRKRQIAKCYSIQHGTVNAIVSRKTWKHI